MYGKYILPGSTCNIAIGQHGHSPNTLGRQQHTLGTVGFVNVPDPQRLVLATADKNVISGHAGEAEKIKACFNM